MADTAIEKQVDGWGKFLMAPNFQRQVATLGMQAVSPMRLARIVLTQFRRNPTLTKCTNASILGCLFRVAELDLEPDGRLAALVPFKNRRNGQHECTLIIGYPGYVELAMRSGKVASCEARLVYPSDTFDLQYGRREPLHHVPNYRRQPGEEPYLGYALAWMILPHGDLQQRPHHMTIADIDAIRRRAPAFDQPGGPHQEHPDRMREKTVFRQLAKWLPQTSALRRALAIDENQDASAGEDAPAEMLEVLQDSLGREAAQAALEKSSPKRLRDAIPRHQAAATDKAATAPGEAQPMPAAAPNPAPTVEELDAHAAELLPTPEEIAAAKPIPQSNGDAELLRTGIRKRWGAMSEDSRLHLLRNCKSVIQHIDDIEMLDAATLRSINDCAISIGSGPEKPTRGGRASLQDDLAWVDSK